MKDMARPSEHFHLQTELKIIIAEIAKMIKASPWSTSFNTKVGNRENEIKAEKEARVAEARGAKKFLKIGDCEPGQYLSYDKDDRPLPSFGNAQLVMRDLGIKGSFNVFTEKKQMTLNGVDLDTSNIGMLRNEMRDLIFVEFKETVVAEAMDAYCKKHPFHPIQDYFLRIKSKPNQGIIKNWLTKVVGAEDNAINSAIGQKMLVAMVARIMKPGTKFDQMIVLEGSQGLGKSTMLEILAGTDYFNSGKILSMEAKEQMEALKGRMLYESADLVGHGKADVDSVKAFLSANADRGRWAYAKEVRDHPRTAIIVGTTNKNNYLLDDTGNRRIWPVHCNIVPTNAIYDGKPCPLEADLNWIRENRDQLFAEAIQLYESGYSLTLDRGLWPEVAKLQNERMADIPFSDEAWEVFGLTQNEGLIVNEHNDGTVTAGYSIKGFLDIRIFSRDIIKHLFPGNSNSNAALGRNVKTAMSNLVIANGLKWSYKQCMVIDKAQGSGYQLVITKKEDYMKVKELMEGMRGARTSKINTSTL
jgi:energy-coupling factor transporter ATP-binding protein EcfA2